MEIKPARYQKIIMWIWICFLMLALPILFLQGIFGRYGDRYSEVVSWFLPNIMPSLSLITGGIVITKQRTRGAPAEANRYIILITIILSVLYCLLLLSIILLSPFSHISPIRLMKQANYLLAPFQSVVNFFLLTLLYQVNRGAADSAGGGK